MSQKLKLPHKILCVAYVATSIDGRIARSGNSGTDWTSAEDRKFFQNALAQMDAVIVGRNTYEVAKTKLNRRNTFVLTSKAKLEQKGSVIFLNPAKHNLKKLLASKNYKRVAILGGPQVYNFCLQNKMLDELFVTIEPYVFTSGVPMFSGNKFKKYNFVLKSVKKLNNRGTILLNYQYAG